MPMSRKDAADKKTVTVRQWSLAIAVGGALACFVWQGLISGGGLVGGDTYPYFMPQKIVLSESFANGEIPLWHNLTGLGYPLHAESQAGVFYPSNQILYRLFDINTAYNFSIVLHYWLAFVFSWRFARCQNVGSVPALLTAVVFVYGWFPARISLEWSIIGGLWIPLSLWLTDRLIEEPSKRRFALLSVALTIHLLAGHFTLAFICQLTVCGYAVLKTYLNRRTGEARFQWRLPAYVIAAVFLGLTAASVQLLPTLELKQVSQRGGGGKEFDPAYGHMPPVYATQLVASWWHWHTQEAKTSRRMMRTAGAIDADSNAVEAHLYLGLMPLLLLFFTFNGRLRRQGDSAVIATWLVIGSFGLIYATGWLMPVTRHLPGFNFFMGPGRYTVLTALGGSIIAGLMLDRILSSQSQRNIAFVTAFIAGVTLVDLTWSSQGVADAFVVSAPPVQRLEKSWIRDNLSRREQHNVRLLAPGPNVANLFQVSCVPQYLGIGPAIYFSDALRPPGGPKVDGEKYPDATTAAQLERLGITHILTLNPIANPSTHVGEPLSYSDSFLDSVWARRGESAYLYEIVSAPARVVTAPPTALESFRILSAANQSVEVSVNLVEDADVVLRELNYPGWEVWVDGTPSTPKPSELSMRAVSVSAGEHTIKWVFSSQSFQIGLVLSGSVLVLLFAMIVWPNSRKKNNSPSPE